MWRARLGRTGLAIGMFVIIWSARGQGVQPMTAGNTLNPPITAYKGSGSCSAVACHGGIAPATNSSVLRNEHTTWISDDRHSHAFEVLFGDRSQRIARNLAGTATPIPAQEDPRCLACHTTPRPESLLKPTAWMNQDGVGCESCHGSAEKWLGPHTAAVWKSISGAEKYMGFGFGDTKNLSARVELCAGCHVGSDARDGLPARDVNHDLIAAGHPRLDFEFAAHHENQPKHWRIDKSESVEAAADFPARAWMLGQLVSAKAALELLKSRSTRVASDAAASLPPALPSTAPPAPWPEFAEYGCFSCHHGLAEEPSRRNRAAEGIAPGSPSWGSWYFPLARALLEDPALRDRARPKDLQSAFHALEKEMCHPIPDPAIVTKQADQEIARLGGLIRDLSNRPVHSRPFDAPSVEALIAVLNRPDAWKTGVRWDESAQRYLALVALNQARGRLNPQAKTQQQALADELRNHLDRLAFPKGFDSPRGFDQTRLQLSR